VQVVMILLRIFDEDTCLKMPVRRPKNIRVDDIMSDVRFWVFKAIS
jgi:hypothetical protein